ncbi:MAG TPA: VCBS repeat-containing protein, partial [Verrucomicrobiae bacterium]
NYGDNTLSIFTNNGSGVFGSNATVVLGRPFDPQGASCVVAADLNGDGKPDLAAVNYMFSNMYIFTNNGFGVFGSNATIHLPGQFTWITAADLNGDGKPDLVIANGQAYSLSVFLNTSPFPPPTTTPPVNIKTSGAKTIISWPSDSAGWSLQQNPDLTASNWGPSGYDGSVVLDDGTNKNLIVNPPRGNLFFRLLHP